MNCVKLLRSLLALGFSVTDLARLFEVSPQAVSQWVHGSKRPSELHIHDLLTLHALASEHAAHGGAISDFTTGKKWSPYTLVSPDGHETESFRIAFTSAHIEVFKAGETLPPRARTLLHARLHLAAALETLAKLATPVGIDPFRLRTAQELDDLYHTARVLQQSITLIYWNKVLNTPEPQLSSSQEDPDA
jgi:transcriptional regulator with XRE-family HTH domain